VTSLEIGSLPCESSLVEEGSSSLEDVCPEKPFIALEESSASYLGWKEEELFHGNWADEVEREEHLYPLATSDDEILITPIARKGQADASHKKRKSPKKKKAKKPEYKLFVGGIIFADLEEHLFEMEEAIGEEMEPEIMFAALDTLKRLRIDCFENLFAEFGKAKIKPNWEKRFCHVLYEKEEDALEAFRVLARAEERKKRQKEFREVLEAAGFPRFAAPRHNFYVRFPRSEGNTEGKSQRKAIGQQSRLPTSQQENRDCLYWMIATSPQARWEVLNVPATPSRQKEEGKLLLPSINKVVVVHTEKTHKQKGQVALSVPVLSEELPSMSIAA